MKLTFKTKGIVVFNCNVEEREDFLTEQQVVTLFTKHSHEVVNPELIREIMSNNQPDYLAAILGCRPDELFINTCSIECSVSNAMLSISGSFEFNLVDGEIEGDSPSSVDLCQNIKSLMLDGIYFYGDFVNESVLRKKIVENFENVGEYPSVGFCFEYKQKECEVSLEK